MMRLSEAVMLGMMSIDRFVPTVYLKDGCGCLIGAGYFAATGKRSAYYKEMAEEWPWLESTFPVPTELYGGCMTDHLPDGDLGRSIITFYALAVQSGSNTIEQAVDWIRSVEPAERTEPAEVLAEVDEAVRPMSIYERWERSRPEVRG